MPPGHEIRRTRARQGDMQMQPRMGARPALQRVEKCQLTPITRSMQEDHFAERRMPRFCLLYQGLQHGDHRRDADAG